jgi:hypothetical protein
MAEKQQTARGENKAFKHEDPFAAPNQNLPPREKLRVAHASLQELFPDIARVAVALYDPQTAVLKTYIDSCGEDKPLQSYQATRVLYGYVPCTITYKIQLCIVHRTDL